MKSIRLSNHARTRAQQRGSSEQEVVETIQTAPWLDAERGRFECRRRVEFNREWNGKDYSTKEIRPIFAEEATEIVVITVYVYYA